MEAEVVLSEGLDKTLTTMKLPYDRIRLIETDLCARTITLTAFGALRDVIDGIDDDLQSQKPSFKIVMRADNAVRMNAPLSKLTLTLSLTNVLLFRCY